MFLDIAIGIGGALLFAFFTEHELTTLLLLVSICLALLPDLDFVWHLFRGKAIDKHAHEHRNLLHYPLLLLPFVFCCAFPFGFEYALLATVLTGGHFVHDSIGIGWGVQWLYPFDKRYFKFFEDGKNLCGRSPEQVAFAAERHGDDDWLKNIYLRPNRTLLLELGILGFVMGILLYVRWQFG